MRRSEDCWDWWYFQQADEQRRLSMLTGVLNVRRSFFLIGLLLAGCGRGPSGINAPAWDAAAATARALSDNDANHDQKLSRDELRKCPGLLSALKHFDIDGDGSISTDELKTKMQEIHDQQAALVEVPCSVMKGGRPLEGAVVTFIPESFMGEAFKPSTGVTARDGTAFPSIADEELPEELRGRVHGVHCGIYRVTVTHPQIKVPAKYNEQTELGWVFSRRNHEALTVSF
jgi:EF hand domain-containing protein